MYKRLLCSVAILGASLSLSSQTSPAAPDPKIDPSAMAALDHMGAYLRTLKTFEVKAAQTTDDVLDNGQTVQSSVAVDILAQRPNRMYVEMTSDETHPFMFYDGKNFTLYASLLHYYATVPAPATIAELIGNVKDKYDIDLPLVDLFMWGSPESNEKEQITSAIDIGPGTVDGTTCEQYAFRQAGLDWQIWIQQGDYPLPRKLILITTDDEAKPRHTDVLTWNLAPSFDDEAFTFDPPSDAHKITMASAAASSGNETKPAQGGAK